MLADANIRPSVLATFSTVGRNINFMKFFHGDEHSTRKPLVFQRLKRTFLDLKRTLWSIPIACPWDLKSPGRKGMWGRAPRRRQLIPNQDPLAQLSP